MKSVLIYGDNSKTLGQRLGSELGCEYAKVESKTFPDGESYIKFPIEVKGKEAIILQTAYPNQDRALIELFLMIDNAKNLGAKSIVAIIPYFAYARQDKRFLEGEAISIKTIAKIFDIFAIDKIITFNIHEDNEPSFFKTKMVNLSAIPEIGAYFKKMNLKSSVIIAPDQGAYEKAEQMVKLLNATATFVEKDRDRITGEIKVTAKDFHCRGKDVVLIDDMIASGGTMVETCKIAKAQGAANVYVACTHALLVNDAAKELFDAGIKQIIATDSIENKYSIVSLAERLAKELNAR